MKKVIVIAIFSFIAASSVMAQQLELFVHSGYTFGDKFPLSGGRGKIYDGHTYGGLLSVDISDFYAIELAYSRQDSRVLAISDYLGLDVDEKVSVNYILAGGNRLMKVNEKVTLFSGLKLGAVIIASKKDAFDNVTKFAVGLNAGAKYFMTEKLGLRVQANLNFPVTDVGGSLWWSPGGGLDAGVSSYTPVLQFSFTGGLVFKIK